MKTTTRLISLLLVIFLLAGMLPMGILAAEDEQQTEPIYILAGSDFQPTDANAATGQELVSKILAQVQKEYETFDGFLFAGDYNYNYDQSGCIAGKNTLQVAVQSVYGDDMHEVYVQGNHDPDSMVGNTLSASGANDPESGMYGVYVINEKDYMWYNDDQATIRTTASNLDAYLDAKYEAGDDAPIFVVSHLPLHYCLRTQVGGNDGKYACYIFDVLQEAGERGQNIIFLYGHNHSHGWDDPYGGAAVYLEKGDNIYIAEEGSTTSYTTESLNFTYMNAGFVAYYRDLNEGAYTGLTMTAFKIEGNTVTVERFDASGKVNVKAAGVLNTSHWSNGGTASCCSNRGTETYAALTKTVETGTVALNTFDTVLSSDSNVSVTGPNLTGVEVKQSDVSVGEKNISVSYDITPQTSEGSYTGAATVSIKLPEEFAEATTAQLSATVDGDVCTNLSYVDGVLSMTVPHFSTVTVSYNLSTASDSDSSTEYEYTIQKADYSSVDEIVDGTYVLVPYSGTDVAMTSTVSSSGKLANQSVTVSGDSITYESGMENTIFWGLTKNSNGTVTLQAPNGQYLNIGSGNGSLTLGSSQNITAGYNEGITFSVGSQYLDFYQNNGQVFSTYANTPLNNNNRYYLYAVTAVPVKTITSVSVNSTSGTAERGSLLVSGGYLTVNYSDGTAESVSLRTSYLSGDGLDLTKNGIYENLTITYKGFTIPGYTLTITDVEGNDYPTYPNPGSVQLGKSATGLDFQNTGLARVKLTASGLPTSKGVDVLVVIDTSSSMNAERLTALRTSLNTLITTLKQPLDNGEESDVEIAITEFNRYDFDLIPKYELIENGASGRGDNGDNACGGVILDWVNVNNTNFVANSDNVVAHSGTNYDEAFERAYTMLDAKQTQNAENGEDRDTFVIFMSDGAPFSYNYFVSNSSGDAGTRWNAWLQATMTEPMLEEADEPARLYYNNEGKHWMAEAIKGNPSTDYKVIRPSANADDNYITTVKGLGATIYSIGLELAVDQNITVESMNAVLSAIASEDAAGDDLYYTAGTDDLEAVFEKIAGDVRYAAQQAVFTDEMGVHYDLQLATSGKNSSNNTITINSSITVTIRPIYTADQVGTTVNGYTVTTDDIGKAYGDGEVKETITFNADGTMATSDVVTDKTNIIYDNKINGKYVTYDLSTEKFTWNIGLINNQQYELAYTVYLTNAMGENGGAEAGSYPTNGKAEMSYVNYLGNSVSQSVASPVLAWASANVSYVFYLVDEDGNPLLADGTKAANFLTSYKVTQKTEYATINLNTGETVISAVAKTVLPDGYELYDPDAVYSIEVNSGDGGGKWTITGTDGKKDTTYVMDYSSNPQDYTNVRNVADGSYDYTHTTVYFAVLWTIGTVPDVVVIDYGLPVDIHALTNDMLGTTGKLTGLGNTTYTTEKSHFSTKHDTQAYPDTTLDLSYGTATADTANGIIRYTPKNMQMPEKDVIGYEVSYTGEANSGYYYGQVTVIPATTIYYEDSFLTFQTYDNNTNATIENAWEEVGTYGNGVQAEDRPGEYSLDTIDANNIYGYDGAYKNMTEFSMGSARKITLNANVFGTATFSFTGTGFDVISLTSNMTGTITVKVTGTDYKKTFLVDTYYGYTQDEEGNWIVDSNAKNSLYQVPVIKVQDLAYGTYEVCITAAYSDAYDHQDDGSYDFYMDAVRIYDPANDGKNDQVIEDAYVADKEGWPVYEELRNQIIGANAFTSSNSANGIVYIDGKHSDVSIADYTSYGPNNELYLEKGNAVAFKLELANPENVANVEIGLKSANGKNVSAKIYNVNDSGTVTNDKSFDLTTSTDMYYSIFAQRNGTIVITNTADGILSITNIKVTYKTDPESDGTEANALVSYSITAEEANYAVMSLSLDAEPDVEVPTEPDVPETTAPEETEPETTVPETTVPEETEPETTVPETTVPEETEPEEFQPEVFEVKVNKSSVKVGQTVKVTVTTSADVAYITVNGEKVTDYKTNRGNEKRTWTVNLDAETVGEMTVEVVAYNSAEIAAQPITQTVTVTEKSGGFIGFIGDLIGKLFGRG